MNVKLSMANISLRKSAAGLSVVLWLLLCVSCATSNKYMVCREVRDGGRFVKFDTAYVSGRSLQDRWVLDSLESAGVARQSDSLIIWMTEWKRFFPPDRTRICVKSDSTYYHVWLNSWVGMDVSIYLPERGLWYDSKNPEEFRAVGLHPFVEKIALNWDLKSVRRFLEICPCDGNYSCSLIRVVTDKGKIKRWDEYKFADISYCDDARKYLDSIPSMNDKILTR